MVHATTASRARDGGAVQRNRSRETRNSTYSTAGRCPPPRNQQVQIVHPRSFSTFAPDESGGAVQMMQRTESVADDGRFPELLQAQAPERHPIRRHDVVELAAEHRRDSAESRDVIELQPQLGYVHGQVRDQAGEADHDQPPEQGAAHSAPVEHQKKRHERNQAEHRRLGERNERRHKAHGQAGIRHPPPAAGGKKRQRQRRGNGRDEPRVVRVGKGAGKAFGSFSARQPTAVSRSGSWHTPARPRRAADPTAIRRRRRGARRLRHGGHRPDLRGAVGRPSSTMISSQSSKLCAMTDSIDSTMKRSAFQAGMTAVYERTGHFLKAPPQVGLNA